MSCSRENSALCGTMAHVAAQSLPLDWTSYARREYRDDRFKIVQKTPSWSNAQHLQSPVFRVGAPLRRAFDHDVSGSKNMFFPVFGVGAQLDEFCWLVVCALTTEVRLCLLGSPLGQRALMATPLSL